MKSVSRILLLWVLVGILGVPRMLAYVDVWFSSVPGSSIPSSQSYYVEGRSWAGNLAYSSVDIWKSGGHFAGNYGRGTVITGGTTADTGPQTIEYYLEGSDWTEGEMDFDWAYVTIDAPAQSNQPPIASVTVDGQSAGATVTRPYGGSVTITVRYHATDADGNLTGIRPQVWRPDGNLDNNGGNFVGQSGGSGEVAWTVTLNQNGNWYFWADAQDAVISPDYVDSGSWSNGFRINVVESAPPPQAPSVSQFQPGTDTTISIGTNITLQSYAEDFYRAITVHNLEIQRPDGVWNTSGAFANSSAYLGGPVGPDAPMASLRTAGFTFDQVGVWHVRSYAANSVASAYSELRTVTVTSLTQGQVSVSPASSSILVGQSVSFTASGGSGSGDYVWGGAASGTGATNSVTFNAVGTYNVTVYRNGDGTYAQSNTATSTITVSLAAQPTVTISPTTAAVDATQSVTFTASGGAGGGDYVWGGDASGTGSTKAVTFTTVGSRSVTVYRALAGGYAQSNTATATITVNAASGPTISAQPISQTAVTGGSVTFTVTASGTAPLAYQWRKNGANITNATGSSLTLGNLQTTDAAGYTVVVSNSTGATTSNTAWLPIATAGGTQTVSSPSAADRSPVVPGMISTMVGDGGYNIQSGSIYRVVGDFRVTGAVGAYPLNMTRVYAGGAWGYSFIWSVEELANAQFTQNQGFPPLAEQFINVRTPNGEFLHFAANNQEYPLEFCQSRDGTRVAVVRESNQRVTAVALHFADGGYLLMEKCSDSGDRRKFRPVKLVDPFGLETNYSYTNSTQELPTQVTDAAGRYLRFYGTSPTTVTKVESSCGKWIEWSGNTLNYWDGLSASYASGSVGSNLRWMRFSDVRQTSSMRNVEYILNRFAYGIYGQLDQGEPEVWEVVRERHFASFSDTVDIGPLVSQRTVNSRGQNITELGFRPTGPAMDVTETRGDGPSRNFQFSTGGENLLSVTDFRGNRTIFDDWFNGVPSSATDPLGRVTQIQSNSWGRITRVTHPDGTYREYTWNNRYLMKERDERGNLTTYDRDSKNRLQGIQYADGSQEAFAYNSLNQLIQHTLRNGASEYWQYTASGLPYRQWEPNSVGTLLTAAYIEYTYYPTGQSKDLAQTVRDPRGNITTFEYNSRGQVTKETFVDGNYRSYTYDSWGNRLTVRDELGNVTVSTYDEYSRVTTVKDPLLRTSTNSYLPMSGGSSLTHLSTSARRTTAPSGRTTAWEFDNDYHVLQEVRGEGSSDEARTIMVYDAVGDLSSRTDQVSSGVTRVTTYEYDARNRKRFEHAPLNATTKRTTEWQYDAASNVVKVVNPDGTHSGKTYNAMNQVATATDEMNYTISYSYTTAGLIDVITDRKGYTYRYEYDSAGRKTKFWYPAASGSGYGNYENWTYTLAGQVAEYFNRSGQRLAYTYDNRNRETLRAWDGNVAPSVSTSYDAASRVLTRSNSAGTLTYSYDAASQLTSETQAISDGPTVTIGASYDVDGRRLTRTATGEQDVNFGYDARGQLTSMGPNGMSFGFTYDMSGARTLRTSPNGTATGYLYDGGGRLETISSYVVSGSATIQRQDFGRDLCDRRTWSLRDSSYGDSYAYQADGQLIGFRFNQSRPDQNPNNTAVSVDTYAYDQNGNRTTRNENGSVTTYSANALNEYTAVSGSTIAHNDGRGNTTQWQGWTYTYDAENRLTSAVSSGLTINFLYDAQGRLAKIARNGVTEFRYFDGTHMFVRKDASGVALERTIWGPTANEALARWTSAAGWHYYHHDPQNSPVAITNSSALVVERYLYDAFGLDFIFDPGGAARTVSVVANPWRFTGQEWMSDIALHNYKNRFYNNDLGRFLQQDPLRFDAGDLNLYRYCDNDGINHVDPSGCNLAAHNPYVLRFAFAQAYDSAEESADNKDENSSKQEDSATVEDKKTSSKEDPGPVVTNPNSQIAPTDPSPTDQLAPAAGGLKDGQVLNQNAYFEKRWPKWTKEMTQRADLSGRSKAQTGDTSNLDGNVFITPKNSGAFGDKRMTFAEANLGTGQFTYVIDKVSGQKSASGSMSWTARLRVVDSVGFDHKDWQGRTPVLRSAFPERIVTRATWLISGSKK